MPSAEAIMLELMLLAAFVCAVVGMVLLCLPQTGEEPPRRQPKRRNKPGRGRTV